MAVCGACRSVVTFGEDAARVAGTLSVLPEARSRLWVGATGRVSDGPFTIVGRVRYGYDRGYWDEWFLELGDGETAWLSEDEGEIALERVVDVSDSVRLSELSPGSPVTLAGRQYRVTERGVARCEGGDGQLPFVVVQGEEVPFADLEAGGEQATLELDPDEGLRLFTGRVLRPGELQLVREREPGSGADIPIARKATEGAPERLTMGSGAVRAVSCARCGGGMEVDVEDGVPERIRCPFCDNVEALGPRVIECPSCQAPITARSGEEAGVVSCGRCHAVVNLRTSAPTVLEHLAAKRQQPPVKLGNRVTWRGVVYEVTGWLRYQGRSEGETFTWDEQLLFSPTAGYLWLELSFGHASIGRKVYGGPPIASPTSCPPTLEWGGEKWTFSESADATILWVEGELPWVARRGDRVRTAELARPPFMLSGEWSESEVEWYVAEYVPPAELEAAIEGPSRLPVPEGVAPHQPYSRAASQAMWVAGLGLLIGLMMIVWAARSGQNVASFSVDVDAFDDGAVSEPFTITKDDTTIAIAFSSNLNNQWLYARAALLDDEGGVIHEFSVDMSYYHGTEGGESWSEGSRDDTALLRIDKAGTYRLGVQAEGGSGTAEEAAPDFQTPMSVAVSQDVMPMSWPIGFTVVWGVLFLVLAIKRSSFKKQQRGEDDDDDDD